MVKPCIAFALALVVAAGVTIHAQRGYDLFQKGLAIERVDGNLAAAIKLYESAVEAAGADRALAARALIRIADCDEKLGQRNAAAVYQRIIKEYADQADLVALARTRLAALKTADSRAESLQHVWSGPDVDQMGTASADGKSLSFTDWSTGDLSLRDLSAGTSRRLTRTGGWEKSGDFAEFSVISPDGRSIAYSWFVDRGTGGSATKCRCEYELRVMPIGASDTAQPRVLMTGRELFWVRPAAWSPDGRTLIVVRGEGTATASNELGRVSIADGSYNKVMTLPTANPSVMAISPDGNVMALDVPAGSGSAENNLVLVSLADGRQLASIGGPGNETSAAFANNGADLLFISDRTGRSALWRQPLQNAQPAGEPTFVASVPEDASIKGITSDGAVIYFVPASGTNIFEVDINGATDATNRGKLLIDRFVDRNQSPSYSPDGQALAYLSRRGRRATTGVAIVVRNLRTREDRELPVALPIVQDGAPAWFPDGRSLLVVAEQGRATGLDYYKVDAATGAVEKLLTTHDTGRPGRRPLVLGDGRTIVYADSPSRSFEGAGSSVLHAYDLVTGQARQIKDLEGDGDYVTCFTVNRGGTHIAYLRFDGATRQSILEVVPLAGGSSRELFREVNTGPTRYSGLAWSVDGQQIFVVRDMTRQKTAASFAIWSVPASGGSATPTRLTFGDLPRQLAIDPAGGHLAVGLTSVHAESGVWILQNYLTAR